LVPAWLRSLVKDCVKVVNALLIGSYRSTRIP
jgi:hypothetical protein